MRALRHRIGRWLLRDAPKPQVRVVGQDHSAADIHKMLLKMKRSNGSKDLGLS